MKSKIKSMKYKNKNYPDDSYWGLDLFLHCYSLQDCDEIIINENCRIVKYENSEAKMRYRILAKQNLVSKNEDGIDAILTLRNIPGEKIFLSQNSVLHRLILPILTIAQGAPPIYLNWIVWENNLNQLIPFNYSSYNTDQYDPLDANGELKRVFYQKHEGLLKFYLDILERHNQNNKRLFQALNLLGEASFTTTIETAILLMVTALEVLFSSGSLNEISHQLAVSLAWLFDGSDDNKMENYKKIKLFYGLRSKIVHGVVKKDQKNLENGLVAGYDILTKAFRIIYKKQFELKDFLSESERIIFLNKIALGVV